jgi:hypothetical protein
VVTAPPAPVLTPKPAQASKPKPAEHIGHGADDAPKLSKILGLEVAASGLALGGLVLGSQLHPHPDMVRATREKIFAFFDKAPQTIKLFGWNVFGGASITEQSTKMMQYTINGIQIGTSIAFHQHVWERIGVVGGQTALYHFVSGMLYKEGVIKKAVFDPMLGVKHLAFDRLDLPHGWLPDKAKRWWNTAVQVPLQRHFGLDADPIAHVLSPINKALPKTSWVDFTPTDHESIDKHKSGILHLGGLTEALDFLYSTVRNDGLTNQKQLNKQQILEATLEETRKSVSMFFEGKEGFETGLIQNLKPTKTKLSAENILKQYFKDSALDKTEAERRLRLSLTDLYKLYDVVPALQQQPLQQWMSAHVSAPLAEEKSALKALGAYLEQANNQWIAGAAPLREQAVEVAQKAMTELLNNMHTLRGDSAHQSAVQHKLETLVKVHGKPNTPKVGGELGQLLDPYFKLSERSRLSTQFSNKVSSLTWVQISTFTAIQCVFLANVLMTLVYHTVARLDPDFDPNEFKVKDIAKKRQAQQALPTSHIGGNA